MADMLEERDCKCDVIAHYRMVQLYEAVLADLRERYPPKKG